MSNPSYGSCPICRREVRMLTPGRAASVAGVSQRTIYRWVKQARVHAKKTAGRQLRICRDSLLGPGHWPDPPPGSTPIDERIEQALRLIQEQYPDHHLTLGRLSNRLGLSLGYLSRLFRKTMGVPFRQYVRGVRMRQAETLLRESPLSIKQVAAAVGYKHVSDFDRHFKLTFGMRPTAYRRISVSSGAEPEQGESC